MANRKRKIKNILSASGKALSPQVRAMNVDDVNYDEWLHCATDHLGLDEKDMLGILQEFFPARNTQEAI